ncbi:MAG: hypothetical protein DRI95_09140 [Bacteroidetes bacterium]|nr:MAG: hypothetical protein DRI95_09140 [Bacteroidota bacterium]RLD74455.1 MAG: hypothetical protein DRJ07_19630 [Bacteroidota bacterium]
MEKNFSEQDSLKLISEMLENTKARFNENGFFYLLWGWLVLIASLLHFTLLYTDFQHPYIGWPVIMMGGGIVSGIAGYRKGKDAKVSTFIDRSMIFLWIGFVISLLILFAIVIIGHIKWHLLSILIIALYGLPTFVSGGILKFKPLIYGALACWVLAIISLFVQEEYVILLSAISVIFAYLIPGYMLKSKFNKNV